MYKRYDMVADQHGDVVIASAILNSAGIQLIGSRPLRGSRDITEDIDLSGGKSINLIIKSLLKIREILNNVQCTQWT